MGAKNRRKNLQKHPGPPFQIKGGPGSFSKKIQVVSSQYASNHRFFQQRKYTILKKILENYSFSPSYCLKGEAVKKFRIYAFERKTFFKIRMLINEIFDQFGNTSIIIYSNEKNDF